jgi:hypothetical protein
MNFFTPDFIQNCISRKRTKKLQHDLLRKKINTQEGKKTILKHFFEPANFNTENYICEKIADERKWLRV